MRDIHKRAGTLVSFLVLGMLSSLGFIVGLGLPAARSEEYSIQSSKRPNIAFVREDDQMPVAENRMRACRTTSSARV